MNAEERRRDWNKRYQAWQDAQAEIKREGGQLINLVGCGRVYYDFIVKNPKGMGSGGYTRNIVLTFEEFEALVTNGRSLR